MAIHTTFTLAEKTDDAVNEIKNSLQGRNTSCIMYFASSRYNGAKLSEQMQRAFPETPVLGCSTAGELVSGKMLKDSIVAMSFDNNTVEDVCIQVVENISTLNRIPQAFARFEQYYEVGMRELDISKYVGIVLTDGLSGSEERVMEKIGALTDVIFIGGSAGDDLQFKQTMVYANGKSYSDAVVLALLKVNNGFDIIKTQSFRPLDRTLIATKVDEEKRTVLEFNGKPAAKAYAEAVGVPVEKAADHFMNHPVGLMVGDEPYVRSPQQIRNDAIIFYCNIKQGMELKLLESTDIIKETGDVVDKMKKKIGTIAGIINFHCILRTLELQQKKLTAEYGALFNGIPTVGFSTYGEEYIGHVNQTSTMLVFR